MARINIKSASQNPLYSEVSIQRSIGTEDPYSSIYESVIQGTADFINESNKLQIEEDLRYLNCYNLLDECTRNNLFEAQYQYELENNFNPEIDITDVYIPEAADSSKGINPSYDLPGYILTGGPFGKIFKLLRNLALGAIGLAGYGLYRALRSNSSKKTVGQLNDIVSQGVFGTGRRPVNTQDGKDASEKVNNPQNYDKISEIAEDPNAKKRQTDRLSGSFADILRDSYNDLRNNIIAIHEAVYGTDHYDLIPDNLFPKKYKPSKRKEGIIRYIPELDNAEGDNEAIASRVYCNFKDYLLNDMRPDTTMSLVVHPSVFLNIIATLQAISKEGYPSYKKAAERYFNILKGINSREVISPSTKLDGILVCSSEDKLEGTENENTYSLYNYFLRNPDTICYIPNIPDAQLRNTLQTYNNYIKLYTGTDVDEKIKEYLKSKAVDRYKHYTEITRVSKDDYDSALDSTGDDSDSEDEKSSVASDTIKMSDSVKEPSSTKLNEASETEEIEQKIVDAASKIRDRIVAELSKLSNKKSDDKEEDSNSESESSSLGDGILRDIDTLTKSFSDSIKVDGKSSNARKITRKACLASLFAGLPSSKADNVDLTNYHRVDVVNTHVEASNILTDKEQGFVKAICSDLSGSSEATDALTNIIVKYSKKLKKSARSNDDSAKLLTDINYYIRMKYFENVLNNKDTSDNIAVKKDVLEGLFNPEQIAKEDISSDSVVLTGGGSYTTTLEGIKHEDAPDRILGAKDSGGTASDEIEHDENDPFAALGGTSVNSVVQNNVFSELDTSKTDFTERLRKKFNNIKAANSKSCEAAIAQFENKKTRGPLSYLKKDKGVPADASKDVKSMKAASKIRSIWAQKELLFDDAMDRYVEKFYSSETYLASIKYINLRIKPYIKIFLHILDDNLMRDIEKTAFNNIDTADISHIYPIPECLYFGVPSNPDLTDDYGNEKDEDEGDEEDEDTQDENVEDQDENQENTNQEGDENPEDDPFYFGEVDDVDDDIPANADQISFNEDEFEDLGDEDKEDLKEVGDDTSSDAGQADNESTDNIETEERQSENHNSYFGGLINIDDKMQQGFVESDKIATAAGEAFLKGLD